MNEMNNTKLNRNGGDSMDSGLWTSAFTILALILGVIGGYVYRKSSYEKELTAARGTAIDILADAHKDAERLKKEALIEAKDENLKYRTEVENELKERRSEVAAQEKRILSREQTLDRKDAGLEKRERVLESKEEDLLSRIEKVKEKEQQAVALIDAQQAELERISELSRDEARNIILSDMEKELAHETAVMIKQAEQQAKDEADRNAKNIILQAIQRSSTDLVAETTVSVVSLPSDEMKGRIIGREGRNIRTLETLTGIDFIIDETPEAVVLSGFDPIRREIAKLTLEKLMSDGRIHPARIEEMVERSRKEIDERIREIGEEAVFEVGIHTLHPDIVKILGRLYFRTSYGQNVLHHSIEVAKLAGVMAGELGEDVNLAKRAGLLHDLGKALDHEIEGSHVEIGAEIVQKYKEHPIVVNAVASHHGDVEPTSTIAVLVAAADALSAARPGARSESLENYIRRLERLEEIAMEHEGVERSFAIQAGREIRVMVKPEMVDDAQSASIARSISKQIQEELQYPGHVKVTVIRETRAIEYAK